MNPFCSFISSLSYLDHADWRSLFWQSEAQDVCLVSSYSHPRNSIQQRNTIFYFYHGYSQHYLSHLGQSAYLIEQPHDFYSEFIIKQANYLGFYHKYAHIYTIPSVVSYAISHQSTATIGAFCITTKFTIAFSDSTQSSSTTILAVACRSHCRNQQPARSFQIRLAIIQTITLTLEGSSSDIYALTQTQTLILIWVFYAISYLQL